MCLDSGRRIEENRMKRILSLFWHLFLCGAPWRCVAWKLGFSTVSGVLTDFREEAGRTEKSTLGKN